MFDCLEESACVCVCVCVCPTLSTPWTVARQAPLSVEF